MELNRHNIMLALVAFVMIQPIIDVLTTASLLFIDLPLTLGVIIRLLYLAAMALWIINASRKSKRAKLYLLYLAGLAIFVVINFIVGYTVKEPFYIVQELTYYTKIVYFHVLLFGFILLLESMKKEEGSDTARQLVNYFLIASLTISVVFIIAHLTGTSLANYARSKEGWTGWFYAGNEIGASMSMLLPITALFAVYKTTTTRKLLHWLPFVLLSVAMLGLGTKVGYGGILIVLLSIFFGSLILLLTTKEYPARQRVKANTFVSLILLILLVVATPFTPVFGNMYAHLDILGISLEKPPVEVDQDGNEIPPEDVEDEEPLISSEQFENLVFSSRETYKADYVEQFKDAPISQKLFGMGFAGNYDAPAPHKPLKMIEMDFHDWFYSFGILGFLYMVAPIVWFAGRFIVKLVMNLKENFNYFSILTGISFLIGIGISYTAGHVLTAPSVSVWLAFLLATVTIVSRDGKITPKL
ncbi:O-antigen ligase family protein [Sporosarcina aquimarina]|uniref:O-antigen ligase family protein n=1 Tax=Sporosarcina aquimarina TaxID=114975 RepID=A0ABU4FZ72_9BACL|nr:O-antigen ligase family protein [Sporosarcina aquimarina]MDW0108697.1 O-antigen ligase family protein [Sporosarcina aquimarina]